MWQRFGDSNWWPDRKRTIEKTIHEAKSMLDLCKERKDIVFYKELTFDKDYTRKVFMQAVSTLDSQELSSIIDKIAEILESRNYIWAYTKEASSQMATLHLTSHYWRQSPYKDGGKGDKDFIGDKLADLMKKKKGNSDK